MSKSMYSGIEGKVALVTGGGRGLGKAICLALAREGADIALTDLQAADETAGEIEALGQKAMAFSADVTREADVRKMVDRIVGEWGGIDILVNNVGGDHAFLLEDLPVSEWDWMMDINMKGLFQCTKIVSGVMKKRGGGENRQYLFPGRSEDDPLREHRLQRRQSRCYWFHPPLRL